MTRRLVVLLGAGLVSAPGMLAAQAVEVRASTFYERYTFDPGLAFHRVSEVTVPIGINVSIGPWATVTLSSGFVALDLESADTTLIADQTLSGALDTEVRLGVNLIPGRLIAVATGAVPTGIQSVEQSELTILGAIASDVIGFAVQSVGSGGAVGGGLVGAVPLGAFALGLGATFSYPLSYQPVIGQAQEIRPGAELRARAGVEGPLSRTTYLRVAGVFARRSKDEFAGQTQNGIGARVIGYLELAQGFGNTQLTLYGYDVYRGSPQTEGTGAGLAFLPKGNLLVGGLRYTITAGRVQIAPRAEYRLTHAAADTLSALKRSGDSFRFGLDVRHTVSRRFAIVLAGSGIVGSVVQGGSDINLNGYRGSLQLIVTP